MRVQSWLSTTRSADSTAPLPGNRHSSHPIFDDSGSFSSSNKSLQSNISLLTLPSIPSVHNLPSDNLNLSVTHQCLSSFKPQPPNPITALSLSSDHLFATSGHHIHVYNKTTQTLLHTLNTHNPSSGSVKSVAVSDGHVITAHQDSRIRIWKTTSFYTLVASLPTVNDRLRRCMLPKNYTTLRRHKKVLWIEHADAVTGLAVANGLIYSVSWDKTLKIWRVSDLRCIESLDAHDDAVNAVAVSSDGTVYTGSADRRIRVWAKSPGEKRHALVATLEKHKSTVNALALNDDGSVLFSGACDRSILVWNRDDSANYMVVSGALRGHEKAILSLIHVAGFLISGSADRTIRMWMKGQDERYCCLAVLEGHEKPLRSLAAEWEGEEQNGTVLLTSGSLDGEIKTWQVSISENIDY